MKNALYAIILLLCLGGGLTVGYLRQSGQASSDLVIATEAPLSLASMDASMGTSGEMAGMEGMDGLAVEGEEGLDDPSMDGMMDDSADMTDGDSMAMADDPPGMSDPAPVPAPASGRVFGGGGSSTPEPVRSTPRKSSASTASVASAPPEPDYGSTSYPDNQVIDIAAPTESFEDAWTAPPPEPKEMAASSAVAEPDTWESGGALDDLPVIDAPAEPAGGSDPWSSEPMTSAEPDPFVGGGGSDLAMVAPSGSGELTFPAASGRALKKVTQTQRGDKSVVHIDMSGRADRVRLFKLRSGKIWVDIEETDVPGGASSPVSGATSHIKEISAKPITNAGGLKLARVQILLKVSEMPNVSYENVSGGIDVVIGGSSF